MEDDEFILDFARQVAESEEGTSTLELNTAGKLVDAYTSMKKAAAGDGVNITYKMHKPFASTGYITVSGKTIVITDTGAFINALKDASISEIYPKTDGTAVVEFTFHGLTRKVR